MPRVAIKLTPKRNGGWTARKRIPKDVRAEYSRLYGKSSEEWFTVGPMPPGDARREAHEWSAKIEALSSDAPNLFLGIVLVEYLEAVKLLERRAKNDYTPDKRPQRFPKLTLAKPLARSDVTDSNLFQAFDFIAARSDKTFEMKSKLLQAELVF